MQKRIVACLFLSCFLLTACTVKQLRPYQPDIQQGNVMTQKEVDLLKIGMSKDQVVSILGNPVLYPAFSDNHWAYVYTFQHSGGKIIKRRLDLYFQGNRLTSMVNNYTGPVEATK